MVDDGRVERHSRALEPELIQDPQAKAEAEALNGLRQYDEAVRVIGEVLGGKVFRLRVSLILSLHRQALQGISAYAGNFRPGDVEIEGSRHEPIPAPQVPAAVEDLCDYLDERWGEASALHLAAYAMWRLNWIHPFADGNGRTARILSFLVLSIKLGAVLPGTPTLPDLIVDHRRLYEDALDAADAAWRAGRVDVAAMEKLLESLLARQLAHVPAMAQGETDRS